VVADVGAGDGQYSIELAQIVGRQGRVYATEIDADLRTTITEAAKWRGLENVIVLPAGEASTGLPSDCCDAVFMRGVYHHLTAPAAIDASIFAAVKPGGLFAVIDFPPSFWLAPWTPSGIPADRGGHGITIDLVQREVESAGFAQVASYEDWDSGWFTQLYCALFRKLG
jgi:predicted methyltransferase